MSSITLRNTKGSPLTNTEIDNNFSNLNTDKYQAGDSPSFAELSVSSSSTYAINVTRPTAGNTTLRINSGTTAGDDAVFRADIGNTTGTSAVYFGDTAINGIGRIAYEHTGDYMRFYTNSAEQMRIDSDGKVGIGTTPSLGRLHIYDDDSDIDMDATASGQLHIDGNGYGFGIALNASGAQIYTNSASRSVIFGTDETEQMRITGAGRIGIGLTNPADVLHIKNSDPAIRLEDSADPSYVGAIIQSGNSLYIDAHTHRIRNEAGTEHVRIDNSGNVGIGLTNPSAPLTVAGNIATDKQSVSSWGATNTRALELTTYGAVSSNDYVGTAALSCNAYESADDSWNRVAATSAALYQQLYSGDHIWSQASASTAGSAIAWSEQMRIDSSGNVGIGGAAPSGYRLDVKQNTAASLYTRTYNADTTATSHVVHQYRTNNDSASIYLQFGDASSASSGQLQYDNSTDTLWWASAGIQKFAMEADGDFHADGDVIAYSTTVSDRRLKEDIQNIEGALEKVNSINGVTFIRKHNGERSAGVIAQELLEVLPEAVKEKELALQTADGESYYVVEYDAVTGLLVEAIKELTKRVEALES